jgi:predicted DNA-binding protein (MmcQ/YjbR family)
VSEKKYPFVHLVRKKNLDNMRVASNIYATMRDNMSQENHFQHIISHILERMGDTDLTKLKIPLTDFSYIMNEPQSNLAQLYIVLKKYNSVEKGNRIILFVEIILLIFVHIAKKDLTSKVKLKVESYLKNKGVDPDFYLNSNNWCVFIDNNYSQYKEIIIDLNEVCRGIQDLNRNLSWEELVSICEMVYEILTENYSSIHQFDMAG